jgi:hypothetical protein
MHFLEGSASAKKNFNIKLNPEFPENNAKSGFGNGFITV